MPGKLDAALADHLQRVAQRLAASKLKPGHRLTKPPTAGEKAVQVEMAAGARAIKAAVGELGRKGIVVRTGHPKGSWAHCYYVSFHQLPASNGPQHGTYPVFLLSTDYQTWGLSIEVAAASAGITARGGWSQKAGNVLISRAAMFRQNVPTPPGWQAGPLPLGPGGRFVHKQKGPGRYAVKGYECGVALFNSFPAQAPPANLGDMLAEAFNLFDKISATQEQFAADLVPPQTPKDEWEQDNAAITGSEAEDAFEAKWCKTALNPWGPYKRVTKRVGKGYDFEFPDEGIIVEVKGFRGTIGPARLTNREWTKSQTKGARSYLCLVHDLDSPTGPKFSWIQDPGRRLDGKAVQKKVIQVTWHVSRADLQQLIAPLPTKP